LRRFAAKNRTLSLSQTVAVRHLSVEIQILDFTTCSVPKLFKQSRLDASKSVFPIPINNLYNEPRILIPAGTTDCGQPVADEPGPGAFDTCKHPGFVFGRSAVKPKKHTE
jgi:hypothetical protein